MDTPSLLSVFDAAEILGYTPQQLTRLARAGKVPCVILPRDELRFVADDLFAWIDEHRREATVDA